MSVNAKQCKECYRIIYDCTDKFNKTINMNEYHCSNCCMVFEDNTSPEKLYCDNVYCEFSMDTLENLMTCEYCGNIWDGCAQCDCYGIGYVTDDTEPYDESEAQQYQQYSQINDAGDTINPSQTINNECENTMYNNTMYNNGGDNEIKPPKFTRQNAVILNMGE